MHFKSSCFERRTRGRAVRSTLILLFAKKFFRGPSRTGGFRNRFTARRTQKGKICFSVTLANEADRFEYSGSWLAARRFFGLTFFPPSPLVKNRRRHACLHNDWLVGNRIQLQQRNCSGFTPDFSRRSTVSNSQRTKRAIAACASPFKICLVRRVFHARFSCASNRRKIEPARDRRRRLHRI